MSLSTLRDQFGSWLSDGSGRSLSWSPLSVGAATFGTVVLATWAVNRYRRPLPPGPIGLPVLGVRLGAATHKEFMKLGETYGDLFSFRTGTQLYVVLNSYKAMKECLGESDAFADRKLTANFTLTGYSDDIFLARYTKEWVHVKRSYVTALKHAGLGLAKSEAKVIEGANYLVEYFTQHTGKATDMAAVLPTATAGVILNILFGREDIYNDDDLEMILQLSREFNQLILVDGACLDKVPTLWARMFMRPTINAITNFIAKMHTFVDGEIERHKRTFDPENLRDFIDAYMKGNGTDVHAKFATTIFSFFPDAIETVAMVLNWILLHTTLHPDVQRRAFKELDKHIGEGNITLKDRSSLPYVEALIMETMRIVCPVATTVNNTPVVDTFLRGYFIPRGANIVANMYAVTHDPEIYPDPYTFKPERFIDDKGKVIKTDKLPVFGMGRRMCIADTLVKMELFIIIATLLQRFEFSFPAGAPPTTEPSTEFLFLLPPEYKLIANPR